MKVSAAFTARVLLSCGLVAAATVVGIVAAGVEGLIPTTEAVNAATIGAFASPVFLALGAGINLGLVRPRTSEIHCDF